MGSYRTLSAAAEFTQSDLLQGIYETLVTTNETMAWVDMMITDRPAVKVNREASYGSASWVTCASSLSSEAISSTPVTFSLYTLARQFEVCDRVSGLASTFTDQLAIELKGAVKAMSYQLADDMVNGTGSSQIYGWETLYSDAGKSAVNAGSNLTLAHIEEAIDQVKTNGMKKAIVSDSAGVRAVRRELREAGALAYEELADGRMKVPSYLGIPVLKNENVTSGQLWVIDFDMEAGGVGLAVGQTAANNVEKLFSVVNIGRIPDTIRDGYQVLGDFAQVLGTPLALGKVRAVA